MGRGREEGSKGAAEGGAGAEPDRQRVQSVGLRPGVGRVYARRQRGIHPAGRNLRPALRAAASEEHGVSVGGGGIHGDFIHGEAGRCGGRGRDGHQDAAKLGAGGKAGAGGRAGYYLGDQGRHWSGHGAAAAEYAQPCGGCACKDGAGRNKAGTGGNFRRTDGTFVCGAGGDPERGRSCHGRDDRRAIRAAHACQRGRRRGGVDCVGAGIVGRCEAADGQADDDAVQGVSAADGGVGDVLGGEHRGECRRVRAEDDEGRDRHGAWNVVCVCDGGRISERDAEHEGGERAGQGKV